VVGDVLGIVLLDHLNAGVVQGGDHPNWNPSEQLAHDACVP
jgi:hypothetical protein